MTRKAIPLAGAGAAGRRRVAKLRLVSVGMQKILYQIIISKTGSISSSDGVNDCNHYAIATCHFNLILYQNNYEVQVQ